MGNFGKRLESILDSFGWKQKDLAVRSGITEASVCKYISGEREPSLKSLVSMADALMLSLDELVGRDAEDDDDIRLACSLIARIRLKSETGKASDSEILHETQK